MDIFKSNNKKRKTIETTLVSGDTTLLTYTTPILVLSIKGFVKTPLENSACSVSLSAQNDSSTVKVLSTNLSVINYQTGRLLVSKFTSGLVSSNSSNYRLYNDSINVLFLYPDSSGKIYFTATTSISGTIKWYIDYIETENNK
jgi:hypothetical protein